MIVPFYAILRNFTKFRYLTGFAIVFVRKTIASPAKHTGV